jgi:hypothetical protein
MKRFNAKQYKRRKAMFAKKLRTVSKDLARLSRHLKNW